MAPLQSPCNAGLFLARIVPDPLFQLAAQLGVFVGIEGRHAAHLELVVVVLGQLDGDAGEQQDGHQVDDGHQPHGDIRQSPHGRQFAHGSEHHHAQHEHPEQHQAALVVVLEEHQVGLRIGVVRHDGGEGEEEDGCCDEDVATAAHLGGERALGQLDTGHAGTRFELAR